LPCQPLRLPFPELPLHHPRPGLLHHPRLVLLHHPQLGH
jgi:hypothetical protein